MQPSRVLVAGRFPPPIDGQSTATRRLASLLDGEFEVERTDLSPPDDGLVRPRARLTPQRLGHYIRRAWSLRADLKRSPDAVLLCTFLSPTFLGHLRDLAFLSLAPGSARRAYGAVHWGNFDGVFRSALTRPLVRLLVRQLRGFVFSDPQLAERCAAWIPAEKRFAIPNTPDEELLYSEEEIRVKQLDRASRTKLSILYMSNMIASKGYWDVLGAVRLLHDKGAPVSAIFCGGWESEADERRFRGYLEEHHLTTSVEHRGVVADRQVVRQLHRHADIFTLPSYYPTEAQPVALIEALSAGTPIITTRHAAIPAMLGKQALFVPPRDPAGIAAAVESLEDLGRWQRLSVGARQRFVSRFSADVVRRRWKQLIGQTFDSDQSSSSIASDRS